MDIYINKHDLAAWRECAGHADPRPGGLGEIAFLLNLTDGRMEMVGCAQWTDGMICALPRPVVLRHAETLRTERPEALPRLAHDLQRVEKAIGGDGYWALPLPSPVAPLVCLHIAAMQSGFALKLSRGVRGKRETIEAEVGAVTDGDIRYAGATDLESFAAQNGPPPSDSGGSDLAERKEMVADFLSRPRMLDVRTMAVARFVLEYAHGAKPPDVKRKYGISQDQLNHAFAKVHSIATGAQQMNNPRVPWTPPSTGAIRPARLPQPIEERGNYAFPDSPGFKRFVDMYGADTARVTQEMVGGAAATVDASEFETLLLIAERTERPRAVAGIELPRNVSPETLDYTFARMDAGLLCLSESNEPYASDEDTSVFNHDAIEYAALRLGAQEVAAWLARVGLTAPELAVLGKLSPACVEDFVADRAVGSFPLRRRILLVLAALGFIQLKLNATYFAGQKPVNVIADFLTRIEGIGETRERGIAELRDGIWRNFIEKIGVSRLADENARLELTGEGASAAA